LLAFAGFAKGGFWLIFAQNSVLGCSKISGRHFGLTSTKISLHPKCRRQVKIGGNGKKGVFHPKSGCFGLPRVVIALRPFSISIEAFASTAGDAPAGG
jgi:hypothetical protein